MVWYCMETKNKMMSVVAVSSQAPFPAVSPAWTAKCSYSGTSSLVEISMTHDIQGDHRQSTVKPLNFSGNSGPIILKIPTFLNPLTVILYDHTRAVTVPVFPFRSVFGKKLWYRFFTVSVLLYKTVYHTTHNVRWKRSNLLLCIEPYTRWTTLLCSFVNWQFM